MSLRVGQEAPDFSATAVYDQEFKEITLSGLRGKWVVLFFYPLDFTFVCPTEITAFSDRYQDFSSLNTEILGVSVDSKHCHLAWIQTPRNEGGIGDINYPLISDLILFKNLKLSLIGVVPNFIAAFFILGIIGLLGIPLDMMTITIAAITIGIAVDNSIHYIYRFKEEYNKIKDYKQTLKKCHSTVGVAILNTSITIVFGFSILVLSNFIPTIYFGIFTGIAMLLAMISVLTLLPSLILLIKPFEK